MTTPVTSMQLYWPNFFLSAIFLIVDAYITHSGHVCVPVYAIGSGPARNWTNNLKLREKKSYSQPSKAYTYNIIVIQFCVSRCYSYASE